MSVHVQCGVMPLSGNFSGKTVAELREQAKAILNIADSAIAYVNGDEAEGSDVIEDGDRVEFIKASGEKGRN